MKTCKKCNIQKDSTEFSTKQTSCKPCVALAWREMRLDVKRREQEAKERSRRFVFNFLLEHPCKDCGEDDPIVLEFDHVHGIKSEGIAVMIQKGRVLSRLISEIAKCEVVCANCHRRRTSQQFRWRSLSYGRPFEMLPHTPESPLEAPEASRGSRSAAKTKQAPQKSKKPGKKAAAKKA